MLAESSVYLTAPVGGVEQPDYLNAVVTVETVLSPRELLDRLHEIESDWQRTREVRWGPRTLDLDLILYGARRQRCRALELPLNGVLPCHASEDPPERQLERLRELALIQ